MSRIDEIKEVLGKAIKERGGCSSLCGWQEAFEYHVDYLLDEVDRLKEENAKLKRILNIHGLSITKDGETEYQKMEHENAKLKRRIDLFENITCTACTEYPSIEIKQDKLWRVVEAARAYRNIPHVVSSISFKAYKDLKDALAALEEE